MGNDDIDERRRGLLKAAGLAGVGAAVAVPVTAGEAAAQESGDEQLKSRYRLNDHVRRYYFLNSL
jgi:hypothetical protein